MYSSKSLLAFIVIILVSLLSACELSVTADEGGSVTSEDGQQCSPSCDYEINEDFEKTFTATADAGFTFTGWSAVGNPCSKASCTLSVPVSLTEYDYTWEVTANFCSNTLPDANADSSGPKRLAKSYYTTPGSDTPSIIIYKYRGNGLLWKETQYTEDDDPITTEYFYDNGRLIRLETIIPDDGVSVILTYAYDSEKVISQTITTQFSNPAVSIDDLREVYTFAYANGGLRPTGSDIDSDGDGTTDSELSYRYNIAGLLERETFVSANTSATELLINHTYNGRNLRLDFVASTPTNGALYTYQLVYEDKACKAPADLYNFFGVCQ